MPGQLPVFPLNTVLFPGAPLPLHIFEQRYRTMIGACLEMVEPSFAVMLIREGDEVVEDAATHQVIGRPVVPHEVGTIAKIVQADRLSDGRFQLVCIGTRRVRLQRMVQREPYLVAELAPLDDDEPAEAAAALAALATRVRGLAAELLVTIAQSQTLEGALRPETLDALAAAIPTEAAELSYFVTRMLAAASAAEKQAILAATSARERLRLEMPLVEREQRLRRQLLELARTPISPTISRPSLN
ncbi:MAG: LON peptidase substrate-binding domain-containing protein [Chloroflexi bacterium]|nr:LON peptidase substrate-binding domain-containing protein [Chloroflexota bacterium]